MPGLQLNSDSEHSSMQFTSSGAEWESSEEFDGSNLTEEGNTEHRQAFSMFLRVERVQSHAKFERMRKEHYRMREAIKKGRELVKSESENSEGDD